MWARAKLIVLPALLTALLVPASAQAAVTIGSNLARAPDGPPLCSGGPCTFALGTLTSPSFAAPGGVIAPVNGTITTWRIRAGATTSATALRVIRPLSGLYAGEYTGAGTSATATPPPNAITPFSSNLPIQIGNLIGIDCCAGSAGVYFRDSRGNRLRWNSPPLADGDPGRTPTTEDSETLINADIEPTSAFNLVGLYPKVAGEVQVRVWPPNPGTFVATGSGARRASKAAARKKRKVRYLKRATVVVDGPLYLREFQLRPTNAALRLLYQRKRPRVKVTLQFTPIGGTASSQTKWMRLNPAGLGQVRVKRRPATGEASSSSSMRLPALTGFR